MDTWFYRSQQLVAHSCALIVENTSNLHKQFFFSFIGYYLNWIHIHKNYSNTTFIIKKLYSSVHIIFIKWWHGIFSQYFNLQKQKKKRRKKIFFKRKKGHACTKTPKGTILTGPTMWEPSQSIQKWSTNYFSFLVN